MLNASKRTPSLLCRAARAVGVGLLTLLLALPVEAGAQSIALMVPPAGAAREGWQALEEGRYREAESAFERALRSKADDPATLLGLAIVAQRLGQTARAQDAFEQALRLDPALTPASLLLGTLLYESGDLDGAIRVYEAGLVRAPSHRQLLASLERWRKEAALHSTFLRTQGSHFTVLFEGPSDEELARTAVALLEAAYDRVGTALMTFPADPVTVVLYTSEQFSDVTRSPEWSGGLFDGRIRLPVRGALTDLRELERVLTHEFTHALVHSLAPRGVPTWLNEGLAGVFEKGGIERARADLAGGALPDTVSLSDLGGSFAGLPAAAVRIAYGASTLAVQAIVDRVGFLAVTALLTDLSAGKPFGDAFAAHAQMSVEAFEAEWRVSLRE